MRCLIIIQSYLIGLWFSLRTHASQIWQNPQQLLQPMDLPTHRISLYNKIVGNHATGAQSNSGENTLRRKSTSMNPLGSNSSAPSRTETPIPPREGQSAPPTAARQPPTSSPVFQRKVSYAQTNFLPVMESVDHAVKNTDLRNIHLPEQLSTDDFTRAVAVATVSALRHQETHAHSPARVRAAATHEHDAGGHGGHDAPSWSRTVSASVLLICTALYAVIAGKKT